MALLFIKNELYIHLVLILMMKIKLLSFHINCKSVKSQIVLFQGLICIIQLHEFVHSSSLLLLDPKDEIHLPFCMKSIKEECQLIFIQMNQDDILKFDLLKHIYLKESSMVVVNFIIGFPKFHEEVT